MFSTTRQSTSAHVVPMPVLPAEEESSMWKGYKFKCVDKEEKYLERYQLLSVRAFQTWALVYLLLNGLCPLIFLPKKVRDDFYYAFVPGLVIALSTLLMITDDSPWCRRYLVSIIGITVVLTSACAGFVAHVHTDVWTENSRLYSLPTVYAQIANNQTALHEIDAVLGEMRGVSAVNIQMGLLLPQVLLVFSAGLCTSTIVTAVLAPLAFFAVLLLSPNIPASVPLIRIPGCMMILFFVYWNMATVTRTRRRSFALEVAFEAALHKAVEASRKADSILNHTLKNTMSDAAGAIDIFIQTAEGSADDFADLRQAAACLWRGARACRHRQAYLQLAANRYQLQLQPVNMVEFVKELTYGRSVALSVPNFTVFLDKTLCTLILDNALSNAFKHGFPENQDVRLTVHRRAARPGAVRLAFTLANRKHPARPTITADYVNQVLSGQALPEREASAMSDQIGLQHLLLAAEAHHMTVSLEQHGQHVCFEAEAEVQLVDSQQPAVNAVSGPNLALFPPELHICCLDDSAQARRLLEFNLKKWAGSQNVHVFGQTHAEVAQFTDMALRHGDIAVLDQHLEYGGDTNILGTDVVETLVAKGFAGLICMRSANNASEDAAMYRAAGAHCVFGKEVAMKQMIEEIKGLYVRTIIEPRLSGGSVAPLGCVLQDC